VAKELAKAYRQRKIPVIVCDPLMDQWECDVAFDNMPAFLECVKQNQGCALFIDESGESIGQWNDETFWLATRSRHYGHKSHFITQRAKQLNPTVRHQCSELYLFNCSVDDAKELSNEFNRQELKAANTLNQLEFFHCSRFGKLSRSTISFPTKGP
jgi:hypothetical protein